jgi:hypothetical protein
MGILDLLPIKLLSEKPLNAAHYRLTLETGHYLLEVIEIPNLDFDQHFRIVGSAPHHAHVIDVAIGLADYLGDLR